MMNNDNNPINAPDQKKNKKNPVNAIYCFACFGAIWYFHFNWPCKYKNAYEYSQIDLLVYKSYI